MPDLILDEKEHIYRLDGRILPGVTKILEHNFGTRPYWTERSAEKGKALHLAIHYLVTGGVDWNTVNDEIKPKVEAFQKFLKETGYKIIDSEIKLFSQRYQFAGTIDLILEGDRTLILADIKSSIEPMVDLQLGGYSILYNEYTEFLPAKKKIKKAIAIELKENGNYNLRWVKDLKRSKRIFLSCHAVAGWKSENY